MTDLVVVDSVASASGRFRCSGTADRCGCDQHRAARISSGTGEFRSPISASVLRESFNPAANNRGDGGGFSLFKSPAAIREPLIVPPEKIGFPNIGDLTRFINHSVHRILSLEQKDNPGSKYSS